MLDKALNTVIMPFGIKLRRTGRYILSHKNSFLIRVQLLDNTAMECTLTVENTGIDCLNAVAQRLELRELRYFGLKYLNKQMKARWVELDKPLKKQVDKNSHEPILFFGVMFYVANIDRLQHEITRYLFYLQLKNNVIDGALPCSKIEAVELASYMLQAEFGNHDPDIHSIDYFRDYILFPEFLTPNDPTLDSLTQQAIEQHERHRGLNPSDAEYNYILKAIHLDGFSEDLYPAKNGFGNDVEVGCSFAGVIIKSIQQDMGSHRSLNTMTVWRSSCHEWNKVDSISHPSKNVISIEIRTESAVSPVHFQLEDADTAKYVWRICEARRKFYIQNKDSSRISPESAGTNLIQRRPTLRRHPDMSSDELSDHQVVSGDFISSQENLQTYNGTDVGRYYSSQTSLDHAYVSQNSLNHHPQEVGYSNGILASGSMYSSPSINSLTQTQLSHLSPATSNLSISSSDRRLGVNPVMVSHVGIPRYRPSPDYEVAVRQRRRYSSYLENKNATAMNQGQQQPTGISQAVMKPRPHSMIYSQQELVHQVIHGPNYAHYPQQHPPLNYRRSQPPMDPTTGSQPHIHYDASHESLPPPPQTTTPSHSQLRHIEPTRMPHNLGSTPELANTIQQQQAAKHFYVSEMQLYRHFTKPPPPYQGAGSASTPDLTDYRPNGSISASSPDLQQGFPQRRHQPPLPTVESGSEDFYNEQQIRAHLSHPHPHSRSGQALHQTQGSNDDSTNRKEQLARQENAVLAYLQRVTYEEQQQQQQQQQQKQQQQQP
uniref:tyrosine-protein phosphatase non-receptor type 14-like isoform X2 n=1 Tax=Ciona intestinalis TaxID=7719 RepID=UPI00089DBDA8|nr:tyrosine-protein phosphatase non-receptor type 14-like isoform X2 [Ciona intestinalis]|eukprot:XP_026694769.1 tyrosine-protein phosphatase non-receptor type 14-like isoform X2 [Ciona intestinalis]